MRVTPAMCDGPRDLFAAIFSSAFKHPGRRDQLFGDQGFESPSLLQRVIQTRFSGQISGASATTPTSS
jgi:hypothetical protein